MKRLKVSLSSSYELKADREQFEIFVNRRNKSWADQGIFIELVIWEDFLDHMSVDGLQAEYNQVMRESDIFVMLYHTKVGPYTTSEFETAFGTFQENGRPIIYTYFKDAAYDAASILERDSLSLKAFQAKLAELQHFPTVYKNIEGLLLHFGAQLDRLRGAGMLNSDQNGASPQANYRLDNIFKLLQNAFEPVEFETFLLIHFPEVQQQFTPGMTQLARIQLLVVHARNRGRLDALLAAVRVQNDYQYGFFEPYRIV